MGSFETLFNEYNDSQVDLHAFKVQATLLCDWYVKRRAGGPIDPQLEQPILRMAAMLPNYELPKESK